MIRKIIFLIVAILFFSYGKTIFAQDQNGQISSLPQGETVNEDYFASGNRVIVAGVVNGDAYVTGESVLITGTINGDLMIAAGNLEISGVVSSDARIIGDNATISGEIGRNLSFVGKSLTLNKNSSVNGGGVILANSATINGSFGNTLNISAAQISINNRIDGSIRANTSNISFGPEAFIAGDVVYWSNNKAQVQNGAKINGRILQNDSPTFWQFRMPEVSNFLFGLSVGLGIIFFVSDLILGLLIIRFFPKFSLGIVKNFNKSPFKSLIIGFLFIFLTPFLFFVLLLTFLGIPLAFFILLIYLVLIYLSKIFASLLIGKKIFNFFDSSISTSIAFVIGLIIYWLLIYIPFLGGIIATLAIFSSLGALFLEIKGRFNQF